MRQLLRRLPRSKVNRFLWPGVIGLVVAAPAAGGSPAPPHLSPQQACAGATATREYTPEAMTFRLQLDLDGCRWWDGSARNPVIFLSRDDGTGVASRWATTPCERGSEPGTDRTTVCEVFATLPHPASEQGVTYVGEATWRWRDGERRVAFETRCTTAQGQATCDDPVAEWHE